MRASRYATAKSCGLIRKPPGSDYRTYLSTASARKLLQIPPSTLRYEYEMRQSHTLTRPITFNPCHVNDGRKLTPYRRSKVDPCWLVDVQSSVVVAAAGMRPRSRSLSR